MKSFLFSSTFLLFLGSVPSFAASSIDELPAVAFAPGIAAQVFGTGTPEAKKNVLNCALLINQTWPLPNAQVTGICEDATTACIRNSLIKKNQVKAKGDRVNILKNNIPVSEKDTEMKILGCVVAIEATIGGEQLLQNTSGSTTIGSGMGGY